MNTEKYWFKFILSGKAEDYIKYTDAKRAESERTATEDSLFNGRIGDQGKQYRG
ncbi:MAG: hypothetical protein J5852_09310 [Clostridia bacterium]|nr:hypothetical protein [Clostridia bacterium]